MAKCVNALKEWAGKTSAAIVYDSTVDEFTDDGLFEKVRGKPDIAVIGFTTDGDVFGGFYSVAVSERGKTLKDRNMFIFSFESHVRCMTPQRFVVKEKKKDSAAVEFNNDDLDEWFVKFEGGGGYFYLGDVKSDTYCFNLSDGFEGLEDTTLTGQDGCWFGPYHFCARLVAVQLT